MTRQRGRLNLDMSHIRLVYFLAVYDEGGLNRAARELGISQQALSKSLLTLESSLGVSLFERTPLGVRPTAYGERLAERARTIVAEAEMAASEIEALRGYRSGLVRLGVGPSLAARRAPLAITELRRRLPDVGVTILVANTDQLLPKLLLGELDLIVSAPLRTTPGDFGVSFESFGLEYDDVVGRREHPLRSRADLTLRHFADYAWVGENDTSHVIHRASEAFIKAGLPPFVDVIKTNSMDLLKSLLLNSDALSLLHKELYPIEFELGRLAPFDVPEFRVEREMRLYRRPGDKPMPAVRLMTEIFREHLSA